MFISISRSFYISLFSFFFSFFFALLLTGDFMFFADFLWFSCCKRELYIGYPIQSNLVQLSFSKSNKKPIFKSLFWLFSFRSVQKFHLVLFFQNTGVLLQKLYGVQKNFILVQKNRSFGRAKIIFLQ